MGWPVPEEFWFHGGLKDTFIKAILNLDFLNQCDFDINNLNEKKSSRNILLEYLSVHLFLKYGIQLSGMGIVNERYNNYYLQD